MIKNFTKTLLVANWILCLIVSFISSANAADDSVMPLVDVGIHIHNTHRLKLAPLCTLHTQDTQGWEKALGEAGYLPKHLIDTTISPVHFQNYGLFSGKTQEDVQIPTWQYCDNIFDVQLTNFLISYLKQEGFSLNPETQETIKNILNPARGQLRDNGTVNTFMLFSLDEKRLFRLHMKLTTSYSIKPQWTCYRYEAEMKGDLKGGIHEIINNGQQHYTG